MKVVSVINYTGGVGKTTVTANLAAYAASQGKRVLMIDLDPQTNLTFSFMSVPEWKSYAEKGKTLKDFFYPIIMGNGKDIPLSSLIIPLTSLERETGVKLDMICSSLELIDIDINLSSTITGPNPTLLAAAFLKGHSHLRKGLEDLKDTYDLVLIDCPPNFYTVVKNAITASDYYIVPARMDYLSTLGIDQLDKNAVAYVTQYNEYILKLNDSSYSSLFTTMLGVVPTMLTIRNKQPVNVAGTFINQLKDIYYFFPYVRYNAIIFGDIPENGIPAVLTKPNIRTMLAWKRVVEELKILGNDFMKKVEC